MKAKFVIMGFLPTNGIKDENTDDSMGVYHSIVKSMIYNLPYIKPLEISDKFVENWCKASEILIRNATKEMNNKDISPNPVGWKKKRDSSWGLIKRLERLTAEIELVNEGEATEAIESIADWYDGLCEIYHYIDDEKIKYISVGDSICPSLLEIENYFYETEEEKEILENVFTLGLFKFKYRVLNKLWQDDRIKFHVAAYREDDVFETDMLYNQSQIKLPR